RKHKAFGGLVPGVRGGRRRLAGPEYAECVSSGLQSRLLMQETQLEKKVDMLRQEKKKLLEDWDLLKSHLEDWKVICKDKEEDTSDLNSQQQQDLKRLEERLQFLLKQKEVFTPERYVAAENLQHHFKDSQMRSKSLQTDLEPTPAQDESHLQKELLEQEPPAEPQPQQLLHSNFFLKFGFPFGIGPDDD
ncbi:centrosomal protein of 164 kDa-like, partial [Microtus ochrogaster]|uniref:Centrosomal protein of 164 kDa-like n=1 Tax=Microtus ochrogaster TaxID=79684 RepID=A0ABM1UCB5_MICOH